MLNFEEIRGSLGNSSLLMESCGHRIPFIVEGMPGKWIGFFLVILSPWRYFSFSLSTSLSFFLSLCKFLSFSFSLYLSLYLSPSLSQSLYLTLSISLSLFLSIHLYPSLSISYSVSFILLLPHIIPGYIELKRIGWASFSYVCYINNILVPESTGQIQHYEQMFKVSLEGTYVHTLWYLLSPWFFFLFTKFLYYFCLATYFFFLHFFCLSFHLSFLIYALLPP